MRTMYDSTTVADIPASARMVAGYVDGLYANVTALHKRFPGARLVTVTVKGTAGADVADCETGDLTPTSAARWAAAEVTAGRHPTIYTMASEWAAVKTAVAERGLTGRVSYWIAEYDGNPTIPIGAVAKQYLGSPGNSPGHYDVSAVRDYWPGVDPRRRLYFLGVPVRRVRRLLNAFTAYAKAHPRKAKHELVVFFTLLVAQPAVHAVIHGQHVTAVAVIAGIGAAVLATAKKFSA